MSENTAPAETHTSQDTALAVMAVEVRYIRAAVDDIRLSNQHNVTRNEWEQRNNYVDGRLNTLDARRAPWWSVASIVVAAAALLVTIAPYLTR